MLFLIWTVVLLAAAFLYLRQRYSRFTRCDVKQLPAVPPVGNLFEVILQKEHFAESLDKLYRAFPDEKFVGRFDFMTPTILVRDIELVKKITVKDFEHFIDHRVVIDETVDPFFGRNLFTLRGQEWKDMRSTLSPAFTSSKMRLMVPLMVEVGEEMIRTLIDKIKNSEAGFIDVDSRDLTTRYANDVIASCAYGLKVNSHTDDNEFYKMGKAASSFKLRQMLVFFVSISFPNLLKKLKIPLFTNEVSKFFSGLVKTTMREREMKNIIRPDMIHLLMEVKKGRLSHDEQSKAQDADAGFATVQESSIGKKEINRVWSENDLIAQAIIFFVAGFEGISSTMTFALHALAVNPDIQEKLVQEIKENNTKNHGKFDYSSIQNMTYMDMVVSEVLRLWPTAVALDRICMKDYNVGKPNSKATKDYIIRKGEGLNIPVFSFHRDPKYFPDPLKFDPERFSEENKHNIHPFAYMPFGLGPRNCIGSRFALCEVKVMLYQLLQHMELAPCEKTCTIPELSKETFTLRMKEGQCIRLKPRNL